MASIYAKGGKLWARLKGDKEPGKWSAKLTPFAVGQEREATRYAMKAQQIIDARHGAPAQSGPLTLAAFVERWFIVRRESGHDWKQDRGRLVMHVLPVLGPKPIAEIRTVHIAELVHRLRFQTSPKLAQRTVRNIYSVIASVLRDAAIGGRIESSPCILTDAQLGPLVDKDPEWRSGAVFTREEAVALISDPRIPADRQLTYAFGLLAGMRPGEVAALRWRHFDPTTEPLGKLLIASSYNTKRAITKGTKTETTKYIPIHATLATMLAAWKASGWAAMMGREPTPDDLILPLPPETANRRTARTGEAFRGYDYSSRRWRDTDLPALGWRPRSLYDTKSTFITLAIDDGADPAIIRDRVTHTKQRRSAFDGYDRGPHWLQTCAEVSKLRIVRGSVETPRPLATALLPKERFPMEDGHLLGSPRRANLEPSWWC